MSTDHKEEPLPKGVGRRWALENYASLTHCLGRSYLILIVVTCPALLHPFSISLPYILVQWRLTAFPHSFAIAWPLVTTIFHHYDSIPVPFYVDCLWVVDSTTAITLMIIYPSGHLVTMKTGCHSVNHLQTDEIVMENLKVASSNWACNPLPFIFSLHSQKDSSHGRNTGFTFLPRRV